jgi:hypothetical protein
LNGRMADGRRLLAFCVVTPIAAALIALKVLETFLRQAAGGHPGMADGSRKEEKGEFGDHLG